MLYSIHNPFLHIQVDSLGAELRSLRDGDGVEYLWQRHPAYWARSSPLLFPWVGRLPNGCYQVNGRSYSLPLHGFAKDSPFVAEQPGPDTLRFHLFDSPATLCQFPFAFHLIVTYRLVGQTLHVDTVVHNTGPVPMLFGLGSHPGFQVPLTEGLDFSDYDLQFTSVPLLPHRIQFASSGLRTGQSLPFSFGRENRLPLSHALFDQEAVVLSQAGNQVSLFPRRGGKGLFLSFPDAPYVGIWQPANTQAPLLCIEPWCTLPGLEHAPAVWEQDPGLLQLEPGGAFQHRLRIRPFLANG